MLNNGQVPVKGHQRQKQDLNVHIYVQHGIIKTTQPLAKDPLFVIELLINGNWAEQCHEEVGDGEVECETQ